MSKLKNYLKRTPFHGKDFISTPRSWRRNQIVQLPRRQRLLKWLGEAREIGITLQVEGGVGYNKDLRELVGRGLLRMVRSYYEGYY